MTVQGAIRAGSGVTQPTRDRNLEGETVPVVQAACVVHVLDGERLGASFNDLDVDRLRVIGNMELPRVGQVVQATSSSRRPARWCFRGAERVAEHGDGGKEGAVGRHQVSEQFAVVIASVAEPVGGDHPTTLPLETEASQAFWLGCPWLADA